MKFTGRCIYGTLALLLSVNLVAEEIPYPDSFSEPIALFPDAMGDFQFPISTSSTEAQAYFNQGFQLMYGFTQVDSSRSFRAAQLADPDCAICYWGEAWAWGSYLNGAISTDRALRAWFSLQQALSKIDSASAKEADMIRTLSVRYVEDYDRDMKPELDQTYADATAELVKKYPDDLNIATLYADALFLLEDRRGYRDPDDPNVIRLYGALTSVLDRDIKHPGACHLYIHATENSPTPELAAQCAGFLGTSIPGAAHINHMPSHTWNEIGAWSKSVQANLMAWHSDQKAAHGLAFAQYPTHNLGMLLYAANMDGQGALAIQAAKDLAKLNGNPTQHVLSLIRFGRFDEVIEITKQPAAEINRGMWDFAQGYAALKLDDPDKAKKIVSDLQELTEATSARYRYYDGNNLLGALGGILQGEIAWMDGNLEAAVEAFKNGVTYYDQIDYDEPEAIPFSPRHWLGAAYIEMGAYDNAIAVYERELKDHPNNGWSLFGIQKALMGKGEVDREINRRFEEAWGRSDIWLSSSKF